MLTPIFRSRVSVRAGVGLAGTIGAFALAGAAGTASALDHKDAPLIAADPHADIADIFGFFPDPSRFVFVLTVNPAAVPEEALGFQFSPDVQYSIMIDVDEDNIADQAIKVQFFSEPEPGPDGPEQFYALKLENFFTEDFGTASSFKGGAKVSKVVIGPVFLPTLDPALDPSDPDPRTPFFETLSTLVPTSFTQVSVDPVTGANIVTEIPQDPTARIFVGAADDPLFGDTTGLGRSLSPVLSGATTTPPNGFRRDPSSEAPAIAGVDSVAGLNASVIVVDLPVAALFRNGASGATITPELTAVDLDTDDFQFWAVTTRKSQTLRQGDSGLLEVSTGAFEQIDRQGHPLVNVLFIPPPFQDIHNILKPSQETLPIGVLRDTIILDFEGSGVAGLGGGATSVVAGGLVSALPGTPAPADTTTVADLIDSTLTDTLGLAPSAIDLFSTMFVPDAIQVDTALSALPPEDLIALGRFGNGRSIEDDPIDFYLSNFVVATPDGGTRALIVDDFGLEITTDGVGDNDVPFTTDAAGNLAFPFVALPHQPE